MGNIPLPALDVRPPQQQDPMAGVEKLVQLKSLMQGQQLQQQEIQKNQQALTDNQARTKALLDWDGKDPNDLAKGVLNNGGSADAAAAAAQHYLTVKDTASQIAQRDAQTGATQVDTIIKQHDQILGALQPANDPKQVPDEQLGQYISQQAQQLQASGMLKEPQVLQQVQQLTQLAQTNPAAARKALQVTEASLKGSKQQFEDAKSQAETNKDTAQATEAQANTAKVTAETQGITGPFAEAKYRNVLSAMAAGKPVSDQDVDFARGYELANRKTTTSNDSLGVVSSNTSQPSGLSAVQKPKPGASSGPQQNTKDSIVDLIGQYRADPALLSRMMYKHPEILGAVNAKYPDFDQTTYAAKNKLIQGFTSGTQSKEINAINTVSGHLDELDKAATALNNGDIQGLNALANKLGAFVGQNPQTTFKTIVHRVGPEITASYVSGGGGEAERFANAEDFSEKLGPSQIHDNVAETVKLLRSKIGALENQYKQTVGRNDFQQRFITPAAQASFNKFAPQPNKPSTASATRTYQGHTYAQQPDGSWKLTQ